MRTVRVTSSIGRKRARIANFTACAASGWAMTGCQQERRFARCTRRHPSRRYIFLKIRSHLNGRRCVTRKCVL